MGHYAFKENKSLGETMSKAEIEALIYQTIIEAVLIATGEYPVTSLKHKYSAVTTSGSYPDSTFKYIFSSECTDFSYMFNSCLGLTKVSDLDTHNGTDFSYMLYGCPALTEILDLDTHNGTDFSYMFMDCTSLTEIPDLDTHNGTDFLQMFTGCSSLTHFRDSPYAPEGSRWQFNDSVSFEHCPLDRESILKVFNGLQTVSNKIIFISSTTNSYLSAADKAIATNKGWTISVQS